MRWGLLAIVLGSLIAAAAAQAQLPSDSNPASITFRVQSKYRHIVQIEFYSQSRRVAWPGGNKAYNLSDSEIHDFRLNCTPGEKICYGAWVSGNQRLYWGSGMHGRQSCSSCCYICNGQETPVITLNN